MVEIIDAVQAKINGVADAITGLYYGDEAMAEAEVPSDEERVQKVAFVRDGVRLTVTAIIVVVICSVVYYVAVKTGVVSWIKSKF